MLKISKLLLPIVGSIALPAVVTIPSLSLTLNTTNSNVMPIPITNDIPNNTNLGQFQTTPSENELIARIRVNCTNAYYNQIQCSNITTTSAAIVPITDSTVYTGTTNVIFEIKPTASNSLLNFFNNATDYNVTARQDWLPTTTPTQADLFGKLVNLEYEGTKINLNQLEIKDGGLNNWVASDDCYEVTIGAKEHTTFYSNDTDRVILKFNKARTVVSADVSAENFTTTINNLAGVPKDQIDIQESLRLANSSLAWYNGIFGDTNTSWTWTNPNTLNPKFELSGNENYTTKNGTYQQTTNQVLLTLNLRGAVLSDLITKTSTGQNSYLAYGYQPDELDIRWACELNGCEGTGPFTFAWSEIEMSFTYGSKIGTVILAATSAAVSYQGSVTLSFTWDN